MVYVVGVMDCNFLGSVSVRLLIERFTGPACISVTAEADARAAQMLAMVRSFIFFKNFLILINLKANAI